MPSIYQLKPAFQNLLRPFVQLLYKSGITANQVTLLAMLISTCRERRHFRSHDEH
jgi:CDP-diacylglycerol---glycerol-3-phosphate 3-phosphatidyltransferase